jgi:hypothetical protein
MSRNNPFVAEQFTTMVNGGITAEAKADYGNQLMRFIASGFKRTLFTKSLYNNLNSSFGHIVHFDIDGFYAVWFSDVYRQYEWLMYVLRHDIYGDPKYTRCDVERAVKSCIVVRGYTSEYYRLTEAATRIGELQELRRLQRKYPQGGVQ